MQVTQKIFPGDVQITGTFQVLQEKPLDDRTVVASRDDLACIEYWYNGLVCAIAGETSLYVLTLEDSDAETAYTNADIDTDEGRIKRLEYWKPISGVSAGDSVQITVDASLDPTSENPVQNKAVAGMFQTVNDSLDTVREQLADVPNQITVDSILDASSVNPVENRVVTNKFNDVDDSLQSLTEQINELPSHITVDASGVVGSIPVFYSDEVVPQTCSEYILASPVNSTSGYDNRYIATLLEAVRVLQAQVLQLQNAFKYGINSYDGTSTAISTHQTDFDDVPAAEPLTAIEEDMLSDLTELTSNELTEKHEWAPAENVEVGDEILIFNGPVVWTDTKNVLMNISDPKQFTYMTLTGHDVRFGFYRGNGETCEEAYVVDLASATHYAASHYNILVITAKQVTDKTTGTATGDNFIWMQVASRVSGAVYVQGYYNPKTLEFQENPYYLEEPVYLHTIFAGSGQELSKFKFYTRYQDFSDKVIPTAPSGDDDYKLKAAHITIRSVDSPEVLTDEKLVSKLQTHELIFVESDRSLRIKAKNNKIYTINGATAGNITDDMATLEQLQELLKEAGLIYITEDTSSGAETPAYTMSLNAVEKVTFINSTTNLQYDVCVNNNGELEVTPLGDAADNLETFAAKRGYTIRNLSVENETLQYVKNSATQTWEKRDPNVGYACLRTIISEVLTKGKHYETSDKGQNGDRVRISAFYVPLATQTSHRCSHAFVELENSSDYDIPLNGCYLHLYYKPVGQNQYATVHCALKGTIPAGGTYLIRGKQYARTDDDNVYIKVDTYDVEWKDESGTDLVDPTLTSGDTGYLCLTYGLPGLSNNTKMIESSAISATYNYYEDPDMPGGFTFEAGLDNSKNLMVIRNRRYIDSCMFGNKNTDRCSWVCDAQSALGIVENSMFRMMFALDPAKQGYTGFTRYDSSRTRWNKPSDLQIVRLNEYIEFPKSSERREVSCYTPRASYLHKNVITGKTNMDFACPNAVTVSFGIDVYDTRCFNWVSAGEFDEYLWIRKAGETSWKMSKVPSYVPYAAGVAAPSYAENGLSRKEFVVTGNGKVTDATVNNNVYARLISTFPGSNDVYTAHKCIITGFKSSIKTTYEYVVGRADKTGEPHPEHCSKVMKFTVYPNTCEGRVYQITDQQGFHWIEYQVWAAAAQSLNEYIANDCPNDEFPILINTGDMTQSGARVNEWLDYYNAGECLFDHLEQQNIIGNNDLCGTDPTKLGTGNDPGKSNPYYHRVFYCYEIPFDAAAADQKWNQSLLCNIGTADVPKYEYLTSIYYIKTVGMYYLFLNSEYTFTTCYEQFKTGGLDGTSKYVYNIYTGIKVWENKAGAEDYGNNLQFTPIYETLYHWLEENVADEIASGKSRPVVMVCHEMPFTVITNTSLNQTNATKTRTYPTSAGKPSDSLGCHMNQLSPTDTIGSYWISRLLEQFHCRLSIGGHKHTYALSQPLAEYYYYKRKEDETWKNSLNDGPCPLTGSLKDFVDKYDITWTHEFSPEDDYQDSRNYCLIKDSSQNYLASVTMSTTKLPLYYAEETDALETTAALRTEDTSILNNLANNGQLGSCTYVSNQKTSPFYHSNYAAVAHRSVVYFMCQATGYKVVSNKELPSAYQMFSQIIPQTAYDASEKSDTVQKNQLYPMFGKIVIKRVENGFIPESYDLYLGRLENIGNTNATAYKFDQVTYSASPIEYKYLVPSAAHNATQYGEWITTESVIKTVSDLYKNDDYFADPFPAVTEEPAGGTE